MDTRPTTYRYDVISAHQCTATDLRDEIVAIMQCGERYVVARVTLLNADEQPLPACADVVFAVDAQRIGVAWGADADWFDARSIEDGLAAWVSGEAHDRP